MWNVHEAEMTEEFPNIFVTTEKPQKRNFSFLTFMSTGTKFSRASGRLKMG